MSTDEPRADALTPEQAARAALSQWVADGAIAVLIECGKLQIAEIAFLAGYLAATERQAADPAALQARAQVAEALIHRMAVAARTRWACIQDGYAPAIGSAIEEVQLAMQAILDADAALATTQPAPDTADTADAPPREAGA